MRRCYDSEWAMIAYLRDRRVKPVLFARPGLALQWMAGYGRAWNDRSSLCRPAARYTLGGHAARLGPLELSSCSSYKAFRTQFGNSSRLQIQLLLNLARFHAPLPHEQDLPHDTDVQELASSKASPACVEELVIGGILDPASCL